jgi:cytochrome c556
MRPTHSLLFAAIVLFVSITGVFVASTHTAQNAPPLITPVATVRQIMNELTVPASDAVFKAVSTVSTANGVEETTPKTDKEWQAVEASAAMVAESANLLLTRTQVDDQAEWIRMSRALVQVSQVAMDAARHKNPDALVSSYEALYAACESCHQKYLPARH